MRRGKKARKWSFSEDCFIKLLFPRCRNSRCQIVTHCVVVLFIRLVCFLSTVQPDSRQMDVQIAQKCDCECPSIVVALWFSRDLLEGASLFLFFSFFTPNACWDRLQLSLTRNRLLAVKHNGQPWLHQLIENVPFKNPKYLPWQTH